MKTLDLGRMPACVNLTPENVAAAAHEAARPGYELARLEISGQTIFVEARLRAVKREPKKETLQLIKVLGLSGTAALPIRAEIQHIVSNS